MTLKELVGYLEVEKLAPFHYVTKLKDGEFAKCQHLTTQEMDDYLKGICTDGKMYDETELGIYLLDSTIDELYHFYSKCNHKFLNLAMSELSYKIKINIDEYSLVFAIYVILHEVSHWLDFKASGKSSLDYALWDSDHRKEAMLFGEELRKMPDNLPEKIVLAQKQVKMYRSVPSEKKANEYAYNHIKEKLALVKAHLKSN